MGRKVHPKIFRIGINQDWDSHYFATRWHFAPYITIDEGIRDYIKGLFAKGVVERIVMEHSSNVVKVVIFTPRPGLVIGKQGGQIKTIEKRLKEILQVKRMFSGAKGKQQNISIEIKEIKDPETKASLVAQDIATQLERRIPHRSVIKGTLGKLMRQKIIKGAKIKVKGRLDGAEIARCEWVSSGSVPLQTLRSDIDYGFSEAITKFGTVGVKVWIYKGQSFGGNVGEPLF